MDDPIDWTVAARTAGMLTPAGPVAPRPELEALTRELREDAARALTHVADITRLAEAATRAGRDPVHVVDRPGLARANVQMVAALTAGAWPEAAPRRLDKVAGVQVGAVLAALATRVLGQFDPYTGGRLFLVAPNVLRFERLLGLDPRDFRLWVCLHEQTHAVQFAAAPWLAAHLTDGVGRLMRSILSEDPGRPIMSALRALPGALSEEEDRATVLPAGVLEPEQRELLEDLTATMSLLEGHADVVMDSVGPRVVRTIEQIRPKFDARRVAGGRVERAARRLAGLEAKYAQYREGAAFVRQVLTAVGHEGLAAAFAAEVNLPSTREIADPRAWVRRVHG